jgi:hypothetical protein
MYFEQFPTIVYDAEKEGVYKDVKNLLRRVGLRAKVRTNVLLYDTYDVKNGDTPESLAFKLYDDPELHWVILLINNITDRYHDWPMTESQFLQFIKDKYSDVNALHHYEIQQTSGDTSVKINVGTDNTDYPTASLVTNAEHEQDQQDIKRKIRLLDPSYISTFVEEFKSIMSESVI